MENNQDLEDRVNELESCLNDIVQDLCTGLTEIAAALRNEGTRDQLATKMDGLSETICEHWPHCLTDLEASKAKGY